MATPTDFATPRARLAAFSIDTLLMYAVQVAGGVLGMMIAGLMTRKMDPTLPQAALMDAQVRGLAIGALFWGSAFSIVNWVFLQGLYGSTLGKRLVGIKVTHEDGSPITLGKALIRQLATSLSALPFYLGFAALLWTKRRQTFHDSLCGTIVVPMPPAAIPLRLITNEPESSSRGSFPNAA